jgi:hypothetical protein
MAQRRPPLLLISAPGSPHGPLLSKALAAGWSVTHHVPNALEHYSAPGETSAALRQAAAATDIVVHLTADGGTALAGLDGLVEVYAPALPALCQLSPAEAVDPEAWAMAWRREADLARRADLVVVPTAEAALLMRLLYGVPASRVRQAPPEALPALLPLAFARRDAAESATGFTLALNDYPVDGRRTGGALRVRQGLAALGRPTLLLTLANTAMTTFIAPDFLQVSLPKGCDQRDLEADLRHLAGDSLEDLASAMHAPDHAALRDVLAELAPRAAVAIFEHCYLAGLLDTLRDAAPALPIVYDAHNVEASLKRELLAGHPAEIALRAFVDILEQRLVAAAAMVLCCTGADAAHFRPTAREVVLMPHGVIPSVTAPPSRGTAPRIGFLGSAHRPNAEAARYILEELAPRFPQAVFEIIGGACGGLASTLPNVILHGILDEAAKDAALAGWVLALNPVDSGGGASLKVADYLGHGLPSLNTPHAARGFPMLAEGAGLVLPLHDFATALERLLADPRALRRMAHSARDAAAAQGWPEVSRAARQAIAGTIAAAPPPAPPKPAVLAEATEAPLLLREAGSIRRIAAARQALGLGQPYQLLVGDTGPTEPDGVILRHDNGVATLRDADGQWRHLPIPLAGLVLPASPPCACVVIGAMPEASRRAIESLAAWGAVASARA